MDISEIDRSVSPHFVLVSIVRRPINGCHINIVVVAWPCIKCYPVAIRRPIRMPANTAQGQGEGVGVRAVCIHDDEREIVFPDKTLGIGNLLAPFLDILPPLKEVGVCQLSQFVGVGTGVGGISSERFQMIVPYASMS